MLASQINSIKRTTHRRSRFSKKSIGSFNVYKEVDIRSGIVLLLVFVDDIAFSSNDFVSINELKRTLRTQFDMKDLGDSKCFLGIEVMRSQRGLEPIASMQ